ncbi:MAG TPA: esterase-like activity of phytase family protein, partial [Thiolapillus brandeum]|nr:esterase-like activity of phytase family protein [Thiolapillus brandeum]
MPAVSAIFLTLVMFLMAGCNSLGTSSGFSISCQRIDADIAWGALSGLTADISKKKVLYAVHDHNLPDPEILVLSISGTQAVITRSIPVRKDGAVPAYDLEGITHRLNGGFWLASEGKPGRQLPNLLIRTDEAGQVQEEVSLPPSVAQYRVKSGLEGIASTGTGNKERVTVVFQRRWKDDPAGRVKIGQYWPAGGEWRFYLYPLDAPKGTGLSAITALDNNRFAMLERDDKPFFKAGTKAVYEVTLPHQPGQEQPYPLIGKTRLVDVLSAYN